MRVKKTTQSGTTLYGWDNDRIFAEYDGNGTVIQETVYFGSTPIALLKEGNTYRIFADQIDTPRVLVNSANATLWTWETKPFGESQPNEDVDGDSTNLSYNLRFPGQYFDIETNKYYNFNRDYNPMTGCYMQSDPKGMCGGINTFIYVDSKPLNNQDSKGQLTCTQCLRACGADQDIENFCRKIKGGGKNKALRGACWGLAFVGETACKGWCYWNYCD